MDQPAGAQRAMRPSEREAFERTVHPHLQAGLVLARWLTRNATDAEDVLHDAYLRAHTYFSGFHGGDGRKWFLSIVRNAAYAWLNKNRSEELSAVEPSADQESESQVTPPELGPEAALIRQADAARVNREIARLPLSYREVLVLRELEDLPYREIAEVAGIPIGTVMSRLARARGLLMKALLSPKEAT